MMMKSPLNNQATGVTFSGRQLLHTTRAAVFKPAAASKRAGSNRSAAHQQRGKASVEVSVPKATRSLRVQRC